MKWRGVLPFLLAASCFAAFAEEATPPPAAAPSVPGSTKEFFVGAGFMTGSMDGNIKGDWEHQWKSSPQGRIGLLIGISNLNSQLQFKLGPAVSYAKSVEELKSDNGKAKIESTHAALQAVLGLDLKLSGLSGFRFTGQVMIDVVNSFESKLKADGFSTTLASKTSSYAFSGAAIVAYEVASGWWPYVSFESQPLTHSSHFGNSKLINGATVGAAYAF
jgi:hypothetical protein